MQIAQRGVWSDGKPWKQYRALVVVIVINVIYCYYLTPVSSSERSRWPKPTSSPRLCSAFGHAGLLHGAHFSLTTWLTKKKQRGILRTFLKNPKTYLKCCSTFKLCFSFCQLECLVTLSAKCGTRSCVWVCVCVGGGGCASLKSCFLGLLG